MPIQSIHTILEYSTDGGTVWNLFPPSGSEVLFFSTKNDASCVSYVNSLTYAFTLSCTDNSKFAADGTGEKTVKLRYSAQWVKVGDVPAAFTYVTNNVNAFDVKIINKCKTDTITLTNTPASSTLLTYSGAKYILAENPITFTHSDNTSPCNTYHTKIVEVSADGGTSWYSSGSTYSDLMSSANDDFKLVMEPKTTTFDSGTTDYTRLVRVSVKAPYATQAAATHTYTVTIKPLSAIVALADAQIATTIVLNIPHINVQYTVTYNAITVDSTSVTVKAPSADAPNLNMRVMTTKTRLYYSADDGSTWTEVTSAATSKWTS